MQIVDTVEVHVLRVPCEGSLPHAKIQVGCIHTLNSDAALTLNGIQNGVQVADVPLFNVLQECRQYMIGNVVSILFRSSPQVHSQH